MRVAIDLTALAFNFSGIERYALNITKNMLEQDQDNQYELIFCNNVFPDLKDAVKRKNVATHIIQSKSGKINKLFLFQVKLVGFINRIDPDCIIFPAFAAPILLKRKNMIDTFHDLGYYDCPSMWKWYVTLYGKIKLKSSVRHSSYFVSVSDYTKNRMVELLHLEEKRIFVAKNAVDARFVNNTVDEEKVDILREKYNLPKDKFYMCLATLEPRKNLRLLIDAYSDLVLSGGTENKLVLAGRKGWKIDDLLSGLNKKVSDNIIITGFVDDNDLPYIYKLADLFIFPSIYEGFGVPPLEAIACGTQTVVSDLPIFKEVCGEAVTFFINNNKNDLKDKIMNYRCIEDSALYNQVKKFDWANSALVYIDLINGI